MKKSMRKGFTLVELLIVIVVIGILSAMMMLSSTEAVSSARAADIISDLRNLKTAALAWYADNLDYVENRSGATAPDGVTGTGGFDSVKLKNCKDSIWKYLGNDGVKGNYDFSEGTSTSGTWYVWCEIKDPNVAGKLVSRKGSVGLWGAADPKSTTSADLTTSSKYVGMFIR